MRFLESIRIGYTKIPTHDWVDKLTRMVSDRQDGKTGLFSNPMIPRTVWPGQKRVCLNYRVGSWWYMRSEVEHRAYDHFSYGYFAMRPTCNWRQKYLRGSSCSNRLLGQRIIWWSCMWILRLSYRVIGEWFRESKCQADPSYILKLFSTRNKTQGHHICLQMGFRGGGVTTKQMASD